MKVAKADPVIHALLSKEQRQSSEALQALLAKVANLPKGALNVRRKQVQGSEYVYHYLVRREGKRVVNQHVSEKDLPELKKRIAERDKFRNDIRVYKKRLAYLERLLR